MVYRIKTCYIIWVQNFISPFKSIIVVCIPTIFWIFYNHFDIMNCKQKWNANAFSQTWNRRMHERFITIFSKTLSFHLHYCTSTGNGNLHSFLFSKKVRFFPWNRCMSLSHRIIIVVLPETEVYSRYSYFRKQISWNRCVMSLSPFPSRHRVEL